MGSPRKRASAGAAHARPLGDRVDEIEFHPAWDSLLRLGIRERLQTPGAYVARAAKFIAFTQVEQGVGCPLSMTHAAVPALRDEPELAAEWEPRFAAGALCGMAMTERQGGSDVRANETEARPRGDGEATLHGHKWFCSAPMSDAFLVLAQAPAGLSCYFVPRGEGFVIERLKDKLGNRSNASGEDSARRRVGAARRRGGPRRRGDHRDGRAHAARLRARLDGAHPRGRRAGGPPLRAPRRVREAPCTDQPLMQNVLADLCVESEAATVGALRLARAFDEGDEFRRVATAVLKYWICKRTPAVVGEALECLGGNGFVEESGLPRLYRESPLNAIWEGSSNVQCLDVLRALRREPAAAEAFVAELESRDRAGSNTRSPRATSKAHGASSRRWPWRCRRRCSTATAIRPSQPPSVRASGSARSNASRGRGLLACGDHRADTCRSASACAAPAGP